jgi:hypothetical protein
VLILTTFDDDDVMAASLRAGASGFQLKDVPGEELLLAVRAVAEGSTWLDSAVTARVLVAYRDTPAPANIWRYRLVRQQEDQGRSARQGLLPTVTNGPAPRTEASVQRIVRNTQVTQRVKDLYDHHCQVCGVRLETPAGPYSEGAHIRPHDGPDHESNVLCLCPNHHALFDYGGLTIEPGTLAVLGPGVAPDTSLRTHAARSLNPAHLAYHRAMFDPIVTGLPGPTRDPV